MAIDIERTRSALPVASPQDEVSSPKAERRPLFSRSVAKVGARDRMFFTERIALLLETGSPLHVALETVARQASHGEMARIIESVRNDVTGGSTFAHALGEYPDVFPGTYVNLVAAAETGGFLPVALERLRDMEERREELRSTLSSALSYPLILAVFSTAVVIFVLVVVFPKFEDLFALIHDQLPITTRWLMATSDVLRRWWAPLILVITGGAFLFRKWSRGEEGAKTLDRWMLSVPIVREIVIQLNVVQMLRVFGLSLGNGVGVVEALGSARDSVQSAHFRGILDRVEAGVNEGRGLSYGFSQEPLVPDLVKQMIQTGEESGRLPSVMGRMADFYEREWRRALGMISKIAEPAMLLIMGGVVGLIVSSLILPIFKLSRAVH